MISYKRSHKNKVTKSGLLYYKLYYHDTLFLKLLFLVTLSLVLFIFLSNCAYKIFTICAVTLNNYTDAANAADKYFIFAKY